MAERASSIPVSRSLLPLRDVVASLSHAAAGEAPSGSERRRLVRRVRAAGLSALPSLVRALCSPCEAEAEWADYLLTRLAGPRVAERLSRLLEDPRTPAERRPRIERLVADLSIPASAPREPSATRAPDLQSLPAFIRSVSRDTDVRTLSQLLHDRAPGACERRIRVRETTAPRAPRPPRSALPHGHENALREGFDLLARGDPHLARGPLSHAVFAAPDDPEALSYFGVCLLQLGEAEAALAHFETAAEIEPDEALHHWNLAAAAKAADRMCRAYRAFERYLQLTGDPKGEVDGDGEGERRRRARGFVRTYRKLFRTLHPDVPLTSVLNGEQLFEAALAHLDAHRFADAAAGFRRVLAIVPDHYPSWGNLGAAELARGHHEEATRCLRRALALKPDYDPARKNLEIADARN